MPAVSVEVTTPALNTAQQISVMINPGSEVVGVGVGRCTGGA